jgi:hypothetical protein
MVSHFKIISELLAGKSTMEDNELSNFHPRRDVDEETR